MFDQLMRGTQHPGRIQRLYKPGLPPCPTCSKPTKATETRFNRRRRVCPNGHAHYTLELPEQVLATYLAIERLERARQILRDKGYLE